MNKGTRLIKHHGTEGPSHDPYSYEELTVCKNNKTVTLHLGLAEWIEIDGKRQEAVFRNMTEYAFDPSEEFKLQTGMTVEQFERRYYSNHNTCKKCGCDTTHSVAGFPGESLNVCDNCGEVVSSDFNEREII